MQNFNSSREAKEFLAAQIISEGTTRTDPSIQRGNGHAVFF